MLCFLYIKSLGNMQINNITLKKEHHKLKKISKVYKNIIVSILNNNINNKKNYLLEINYFLKNDLLYILRYKDNIFEFLIDKYYCILNSNISINTKIILIKIITM